MERERQESQRNLAHAIGNIAEIVMGKHINKFIIGSFAAAAGAGLLISYGRCVSEKEGKQKTAPSAEITAASEKTNSDLESFYQPDAIIEAIRLNLQKELEHIRKLPSGPLLRLNPVKYKEGRACVAPETSIAGNAPFVTFIPHEKQLYIERNYVNVAPSMQFREQSREGQIYLAIATPQSQGNLKEKEPCSARNRICQLDAEKNFADLRRVKVTYICFKDEVISASWHKIVTSLNHEAAPVCENGGIHTGFHIDEARYSDVYTALSEIHKRKLTAQED